MILGPKLKFRFFEKATNFWKNAHLFDVIEKTSKTSRRFFQILWLSQNVLNPLQNKKDQKNLGYPMKKQSFSL